jgi:hypothetical protein
VSSIRQQPQVVSCLLFQYRGGENVLVGEYPDYETAYKAARDTNDPDYRIFKTVETFTRTRECSFNRHKREEERELLANRDTNARSRAQDLTELSDQQLNEIIKKNGLGF